MGSEQPACRSIRAARGQFLAFTLENTADPTASHCETGDALRDDDATGCALQTVLGVTGVAIAQRLGPQHHALGTIDDNFSRKG
jgi:hypothetical protein